VLNCLLLFTDRIRCAIKFQIKGTVKLKGREGVSGINQKAETLSSFPLLGSS
jgi:hypothetical protein